MQSFFQRARPGLAATRFTRLKASPSAVSETRNKHVSAALKDWSPCDISGSARRIETNQSPSRVTERQRRKTTTQALAQPGQAQWREDEDRSHQTYLPGFDGKSPLSIEDSDLSGWKVQLVEAGRTNDEGVWRMFKRMLEQNQLHALVNADAEYLRSTIIDAAVHSDEDKRLELVVQSAKQLFKAHGFKWSNLYIKIIHSRLTRCAYDEALAWHERLTPDFSPEIDMFGILIANFVVDPTPELQVTLGRLYLYNASICPHRRSLYDYIIPALYDSGQSQLAKEWRNKLLYHEDFPMTSRSLSFLRFLDIYCGGTKFTPQELVILRQEAGKGGSEQDFETHLDASSGIHKGRYSDSILAKWFASTWMPVELGINLVQKLGVRTIGPRSLQSLALREPNAKGVAAVISHLEKLDVQVATNNYTKALVLFATRGEDALLESLLHCDIHPDEFDDPETRRMLLAASKRDRNSARAKLIEAVENVIDKKPAGSGLHKVLRRSLRRAIRGLAAGVSPLSRVKAVLDLMEARNTSMTQQNATELLVSVFEDLPEHPRENPTQRQDLELRLHEAIDVTRRISLHDVAIPLEYWRQLIYLLGRLGLFEQLEQLCLEIVQFYHPPYGGLVPVHPRDLPQSSSALETSSVASSSASPSHEELDHELRWDSDVKAGLKAHTETPRASSGVHTGLREQKETSAEIDEVQRKYYIPADLPFSHHEHPIYKLFEYKLQRTIVRWGFDRTLARPQHHLAVVELDPSRVLSYDVACGVRILAALRDQGVHITQDVVRKAVFMRMAVATLPGRAHRTRDSHELSLEALKRLVDDAWGSEIMPNKQDVQEAVDELKPKLWRNYNKLLQKSFDHHFIRGTNKHGAGVGHDHRI